MTTEQAFKKVINDLPLLYSIGYTRSKISTLKTRFKNKNLKNGKVGITKDRMHQVLIDAGYTLKESWEKI
jgi:hypothetical protein